MSGLRIGYGERVVSPPRGLDLSGYGFYLGRKAGGVLDDLKARALVLSDGGRPLVIIGCDLIGLPVATADAFRTGIAADLATDPSRVLLACSHTHSGPATESLPGLGARDRAQMDRVRAAVRGAAAEAAAALRDARFGFAFEAVEPLGYNRRRGDFRDIDPWLKALVFRTKDRTTFLFNYACHPVVLGRTADVSADWPGAAVRAVEKSGHRAVFLQGFCGDIDPVTQLNRWGEGTEADLRLYGEIIARRLEKGAAAAGETRSASLDAAEERIDVPLRVPRRAEIERRARSFARDYADLPGGGKFAAAWRERAFRKRAETAKSPFVGNVPVQALRIGPVRILGLPGEPFCGIGLKIRKAHDPLVPVGYANGLIGYIPTRAAYGDPFDYAASCAPMFFQTFPFRPDVEQVFLGASRRLLKRIGR
jgi:hypothetical protein